MNKYECPLCRNVNTDDMLLNLECGILNDSFLYKDIQVLICEICGHAFNKLTNEQYNNLLKYYATEYTASNLASVNKDKNTTIKYLKLYNIVSKYSNKKSRVLDIGCANGGFLAYLHNKGYTDLHGVEPIGVEEKYAEFSIKKGTAEKIPYEDSYFDIICMDQVLEHVYDVGKVFDEINRVIKPNGFLCVSLPNASKYHKKYFFDFYFFLLKEHIQHFDLSHLKFIGNLKNFKYVEHKNSDLEERPAKIIFPNLTVVFQLHSPIKIKTGNIKKLKKILQKYTKKEYIKLKKKQNIINNLKQTPLYIWGIHREFFYLWKNTNLSKCNIQGLIDSNKHKQENFKVDSILIQDKKILKKASKDSVVLITAFAHVDKIKKEIKELGFKGKFINV